MTPLVAQVTYAQVVGLTVMLLREERGISMFTLTQRLGLAAMSGYSRWETGQTIISVQQLAQLADVFEMTPTAILTRADAAVARLRQGGVEVIHGRDAKPTVSKARLLAALATV